MLQRHAQRLWRNDEPHSFASEGAPDAFRERIRGLLAG
jgi:hypothetical protein